MGAPPLDQVEEVSRLNRAAQAYVSEASRTETQANDFIAARAIDRVAGPDVLVLGAATGCWMMPLLARFEHVDVVDAVAHFVDPLVAAYPGRVRGFTSLFEEFQPAAAYDTVIAGHVLEHVADPVRVLQAAARWLKPGGRVVITVPNADSLHRQVGVRLGVLSETTSFSAGDVALGHRRVYTRDRLATDIAASGLITVELTGLGLKPLSNGQMDAWNDELRAAWFALGDDHPGMALALLAIAERRA